jgi:hypothetical protein
VDAHARTQFSRAFLRSPLNDLANGEVFAIRLLPVEKRRRNEGLVGDFDFRHYSSYRLTGRG